MSRYLAFLTAVVLPALLLGSGRSQDAKKPQPAKGEPVLRSEDDAKTVLAKAVKAYGGDKAFARWNCGYVKYKTKGGIIPAVLGEATGEDTFQLPGHFKRQVRTAFAGRETSMVFVINNGKGWSKRGDAPAQPIDNDFTEKTEHLFAGFCGPSWLSRLDPRLTKLDAEKVDGREALVVRAESDELGQMDLYFSKETGLLLKSKRRLPGTDPDKSAPLETTYEDYKEVDKGMIPMRIKGHQGGKLILDLTLIEVKFADKFDEGTFAKP
jgi:hypothetical protein